MEERGAGVGMMYFLAWFLDMDRARKYIKPSPRRLRPAGEALVGV